MSIQLSWIIIPSAFAGLLGLVASRMIWNKRYTKGSIPLILLFISTSIWALSYSFELLVSEYSSKVFWVNMESIGIATVPVFYLLFCMQYTRFRNLNIQRFFIYFSILPFITLILTWTNPYHYFIWSKLTLHAINGLSLLELTYGFWAWFFIVYAYGLYLAGMYFLIQYFFKTPRNLRLQISYVIYAGLIPGIANLLHISDILPYPMFDPTPLSFLVSGFLILRALYFHSFLDIIPIARDTTIDNMRDGIVVVDLLDRIVDINPSAEKIIQKSFNKVVGKASIEILPELADWISISKEAKTPVKVLNIGEGKEKQIYVLNLIPLVDVQESLIGHSIVFHNNTESHNLNKNIKDQADRLAVLYEIGKAITSTLEIDDLMELIYKQLSRVIPSDAYFVALYLPKEHQLDIRVMFDQGKRYTPDKQNANEGLSSWIVQNKKPLLIRDLRKEMNTLSVKPVLVGEKRLSRSWLGVPLLMENDLIGLLAVASYSANEFDETDQLLMEQIAQQAVLSIQNARHHQEVTLQAKLDSLTGVSNHNNFIDRLYEEAEEALGSLTPLSLIMLDIDYFKLYNDTYGHVVGDQVLRLTVQAIQSHIKKTDAVGRWGGEEFGVILPNATTEQATQVANRIRHTLAELPLFDVEGQTIPKPTISQGIGNLPEHTNDVDDLIIIADRALYKAKDQGRDQVAVGIPSKV